MWLLRHWQLHLSLLQCFKIQLYAANSHLLKTVTWERIGESCFYTVRWKYKGIVWPSDCISPQRGVVMSHHTRWRFNNPCIIPTATERRPRNEISSEKCGVMRGKKISSVLVQEQHLLERRKKNIRRMQGCRAGRAGSERVFLAAQWSPRLKSTANCYNLLWCRQTLSESV